MTGKAYIGTSGWQYGNWRGIFYPENLPYSKWLEFYSRFFDTVEVNSSFYRQTRASTFKKWQEETPKDFVFAVKGNRFITHIKRLKDVKTPLKIFFENTGVLSGGRHAILWQLPPSLKKDIQRLRQFLSLLENLPQATRLRHAFEFRHETWVDDEVFTTLQRCAVACTAVLQDWKDWPILPEPVGSFVYVRFHGNKILYTSGYSKKELEEWAIKMREWLKEGKDVYAYFNNDAAGFAVPNAKSLKELIEK